MQPEYLNKIVALINKYSTKHPLALDCGGEYIMQSDDAQVDALDLVSDIYDVLSEVLP